MPASPVVTCEDSKIDLCCISRLIMPPCGRGWCSKGANGHWCLG